jgi:excinuclease UvrABC nuclease subunit
MIDLKSVPGLGEKSRNTLLHKYQTMANLKNATMNELRTLIGDKRAKALTAFMDELKANES